MRGLDSGRLMVGFLLLVPLAGAARFEIRDFDLWWHLEAGAWIARHAALPESDPFAWTAAGREWIAYSWLAEILLHALRSVGGLIALVWLQAALATALIGIVYLSCRVAGARRVVAVVVSALVACATAFVWGIRPLALTHVLLALLVWGIRSPDGDRWLPWIAPPVVALWANVHILFAGGVALLAFAAVTAPLDGRGARRLWIATGLSALAMLANPWGVRLLGHVFVIGGQGAIAPEILEFQSPDFHGVFGLMLAAFLFPALIVLAVSEERLSWLELGTFVVPLAMGLVMTRNMALFAILAAPTVARHLDRLLPPEPPLRPPGVAAGRLNLGLLAGGAAFALSCLPWPGDGRPLLAEGRYPQAAADYVAARHAGARLLNPFNWGGYLIERLHPGTQVAIDGRTNLFDDWLPDYMRMHYVLDGWRVVFDRLDPEVVIWPADAPLAAMLGLLPGWSLAYEDEVAVVFVASGAGNGTR